MLLGSLTEKFPVSKNTYERFLIESLIYATFVFQLIREPNLRYFCILICKRLKP